MKRHYLLAVALAMILAVVCASVAPGQPQPPIKVIQFFGHGCFPTQPNGQSSFQMQQGWYDNQLVWFISTDTNDIKFATDNYLTLAPKLSSGLGTDAVDEIYIVCNFDQGPVFESAPPNSDYTPIWHVNYVVWKDVRQARPITNNDPASPSNPNGLPDASLVTINSTSIVFDCPIVAVGPLGGPWLPAPAGTYRIPQGVVFPDYTRSKQISLPFFLAYSQDQLTRKIVQVLVTIPDAADPACASLFKANLAPPLAVFPSTDSQRLWCLQSCTGCGQSCQLPIEEFFPTSNSARNTQFNYSPIEIGTKLDRSLLPASATIVSGDQVLFLISKGLLTPIEVGVLNTPISIIDF